MFIFFNYLFFVSPIRWKADANIGAKFVNVPFCRLSLFDFNISFLRVNCN